MYKVIRNSVRNALAITNTNINNLLENGQLGYNIDFRISINSRCKARRFYVGCHD